MGGATERAQALLDPLSANSDCASAFKDEKEEGGRESRRGRRAEGRLRKHLRLRLLEREAEWLYVPLCQEPPPMTEDQLAEQAEVWVSSQHFPIELRDETMSPPSNVTYWAVWKSC